MTTLAITIEDVELWVTYNYKPAIEGIICRAPDDCYEGESEEIEILSVEVDGNDTNLLNLLSDDIITNIEIKIHNYEVRKPK